MKRATRRKLLWSLGAVALLAFVYAIIAAGGDAPPPPPPGQQPVVLKHGHVRGSRISIRSWTFDYDRGQTSPDGTVATIDGIRNGVYYKNGKPYLTLRAEHVSANLQSFDFTATGDVHIEDAHHTGERRSFDTDLVQWTNSLKTLTLPHPSLIRTGDNVLKVQSVTVDVDRTQVRTGQIDGAFSVH